MESAKVVFISGYAEDAFEKNLEGQTDFAFLPKPFTLKQLAEAVKDAMALEISRRSEVSVIESLAASLPRAVFRPLARRGGVDARLGPCRGRARTFISIDREGARETADHVDRLRRRGRAPSPFAGIPMSVKDLFDLAGEVTRAGSVILKEEAPATVDALAIARLKSYGFIVLGRTNMTEFAYSGVGLNPHYGTPLCVYDRATGRIPGGSSVRRGGLSRRRDLRCRYRHRYRWVIPHPGGVQRHCRVEADGWPGADAWRLSLVHHLGRSVRCSHGDRLLHYRRDHGR